MVGTFSRKSVIGWGPSRRFGTGRETLSDVRNCSGDPPGGPEVVGRPSRRSKIGREALTDVQKWLRDTPVGLEVV